MADNSKLIFSLGFMALYMAIFYFKNRNNVRRPTDFLENVRSSVKSAYSGDDDSSPISRSGRRNYAGLGQLRSAFRPHYEQHVKPMLNTFESKRVMAVSDFYARIPYAAVFMILVAVANYFLYTKYMMPEGVIHTSKQSGDSAKAVLVIFFFAFAAASYYVYLPINNYKEDVKEVIFPRILSYFSKDIEYFPLSPRDIIQTGRDSCLPIGGLDPLVGDYVSGSYNGANYELNEVSLSTRGKHRRVVFEGTYIVFSTNKPFTGTTVLKKDMGKIGNFFTNDLFSDKMERVRLEDPRFEHVFEIFSTDQIESRYLLTTSFMERLLKLSDTYGVGNVQCSFYNNQILLTLNTRQKYFEVNSVFRPCTFDDDIDQILIQMNEIFQIIDTLKLNQKIGM